MEKNKYYRARISLLKDLIINSDEENVKFFRNGFFPKGFNENELVAAHQKTNTFSDNTLTFVELSSFSTFFAMHPENIAGAIVQTSSRDFPVKVKGKIQDIEKVLKIGPGAKTDNNKVKILKLRARALKLKLELLKF